MPRARSLLHSLRLQLGRQDATRELGWMRAHVRKSENGSITLRALLERRVAAEPLQYILGTQPFGSLDLLVRAPVLIPRPETEDWTLRLAELLRNRMRDRSVDSAQSLTILDLCTGTGCIPLLLAATLPKHVVRALGVDINPQAVELATENARRCGLSGAVAFEEHDLFAHDDFQPADVLTANPPYIPGNEYALLPRSVRVFEDRRALLGDDEAGLRFYPRIASMLPRWVKPGGIAAAEVGKGQSDAVREIFLSHSGGAVERAEVWDDPWGVPRTVVAFLR